MTRDPARGGRIRNSRWRPFLFYWLPVFLYVGMIFALSSIHGPAIPKFFPNVDKLQHLLEYSLFGLLAGRAIRFTLGGAGRRLLAALGTMGFGAIVGGLDELYQSRVPGRTPDVLDWVVDVVSVGLAVLVTQLVHTRPITKQGPTGGPAESKSETTEKIAR